MNMEIRENNKINRKPFDVPERYFDTLHDKIMQRLPQSNIEAKQCKRIKLLNSASKWSYAAAMVLIFLVGGTLYYNDIENANERYAANDEYNTEYIEELLDNYPIDKYTLYSYLINAESGY